MKPFIHVLLTTGHLYEIPTAAVVDSRAGYYHKQFKDTEFPTIESAKEDTEGLFEDSGEIRDWALNNMVAAELMEHARLVRFTPPEPDLAAGDWSYHEHNAIIPQLDSQTVMAMPLEMAVSAMATHKHICQITTFNDADGKPFAAMALITGPEAIVGTYVGAMQHLTNAYVDKPADAVTQ